MPHMPSIFRTVAPAILAMGFAHSVSAEPNRVEFPADLDALEHYTAVTRGDVTEFIYTSRAALDAIKAGEPVPSGPRSSCRTGARARFIGCS